jgi:hypothetical protein
MRGSEHEIRPDGGAAAEISAPTGKQHGMPGAFSPGYRATHQRTGGHLQEEQAGNSRAGAHGHPMIRFA